MSRSLPAPATFTVGYHDIDPDVSVNHQLNRFSDGSAKVVAEMRGVAARIHDYRDYVRELTALSQQAFAHDRPLHGAPSFAQPSSSCSRLGTHRGGATSFAGDGMAARNPASAPRVGYGAKRVRLPRGLARNFVIASACFAIACDAARGSIATVSHNVGPSVLAAAIGA
jgi:hypothetical protein